MTVVLKVNYQESYENGVNKFSQHPGVPIALSLKGLAKLADKTIIKSSTDAIIGLNPDRIITSWNPAAEKLYGFTKEEVIGKSINITVPKSRKDELVGFKKMAIKGRTHFETQRIRKDQTLFDASLTFTPIFDSKKKLIGFSMIVHDISEQKKLENLKKEFLAVAAHELKTPITTLKLLSQSHIFKFQKYGSDKIALQELVLMDKELDRLTRLVNDILDDQRVESGKLQLNLKSFNINDLIASVIMKAKIIYPDRKITFNPKGQLKVLADPQRIEQVIINLISNAAKYSAAKTPINIFVKEDQNKAVIWVKDQGKGIPKNQQSIIFDRFYQVKSHSPQGFGLGLYISKQIVEKNKGKIWVKSAPGKGSIFYFSLPLDK